MPSPDLVECEVTQEGIAEINSYTGWASAPGKLTSLKVVACLQPDIVELGKDCSSSCHRYLDNQQTIFCKPVGIDVARLRTIRFEISVEQFKTLDDIVYGLSTSRQLRERYGWPLDVPVEDVASHERAMWGFREAARLFYPNPTESRYLILGIDKRFLVPSSKFNLVSTTQLSPTTTAYAYSPRPASS